MKHTQCHDMYLDNLVKNLEQVGENRKEISWIMKDGLWMKEDSYNQYKLADLICVYYKPYASGIELKSSTHGRSKAKKQLESTGVFIHDMLGIKNFTLKAVYYNKGRYNYEIFKQYKR